MPRRSVPAALALSVALVVSLGAGVVGVSPTALAQEVPDARLTVTDATVTPAEPVTGAPTTIDATVSLSGGSTSPVSLQRVDLVEGGETIASADDLGALSAGGTLTVPLTATFDQPGQRDLELVVVGENASGGEVSATRPLTVVVESAPPLLTVQSSEAVAGTQSQVAVEVANPTTAAMRNVVVDVQAGDATGRATLATLAGGATETVNVTVAPESTGDVPVDATVTYTTAAGSVAETTTSTTLAVSELREDVGVRVERASQNQQSSGGGSLQDQLGSLVGGGATGGAAAQQGSENDDESSGSQVAVTVTNFGNAPIREVVVQQRSNGSDGPRYAVGTLAPGASESVPVDLSRVPGGQVQFETTYSLAGESGSETAAYDYRPQTGAIRVTGVNLTVTDGTLRIEGNAGNTGEATVSGVVVAVAESESVGPAYPQRDYFVGSVEGSEFAPFELTADIDLANASSVPVDVTYVVNGVERADRVELPLDGVEERERGGSDFPLSLSSAFVVVLLAAAAVAVAVRFR
ncbi:CARDB domain-containing protein [Halomarina salina]|uniref:CARDB domain-containing protein n=1 Tax=Halomarina salina TaxID=1872699 RepID=A0ABD5RKD6_9EURY|nr:CARDB domain-containing protein [Halomarina salina]